MRNIIVFFFIILFITKTTSIQAQTDPKVKLIKLYAQEWGFLTYYTSASAENEREWFSLLASGIKELNASDNSNKFKELSDTLLSKVIIPDKVLNLNWQANEKDTLLNPNLYSWMDNPIFDEVTRHKFNIIRQNPVLSPSCFRPLRFLPDVFSDTSRYMPLIRKAPPVSNAHEAVAGFIVFWNAANYYSGHPIGKKHCWDNLLDEFIPQFLAMEKTSEKDFRNHYRDLLQQAISRLEDSHVTSIKFTEGVQGYIQVDYIDSVCYITKVHPKLSEKYGIRPGDAIVEKDGILMTVIHDNLKKYFAGSHALVTDRNMLPYLLTFTSPTTSLKILKPDKTIIVTDIKLADIQNLKATDNINEFKNWKPYNGIYSNHRDTVFDNSIVYINIGHHTEKSLKKTLEQNSDKRYFIFDFRNYPYNVYFIFTETSKGIYYQNNSSIPDKSYKEFNTEKIPGFFQKETKSVPCPFDRPGLLKWEKFNKNNDKKVFLLCNEYSQSKTESVLAYFAQVTNGTIIGRNTAGVPVSTATVYLPGKIFLMFTIGEGYDSKHQLISGKGISPDVYVKKDIQNIVSGKDDILDIALGIITNEK